MSTWALSPRSDERRMYGVRLDGYDQHKAVKEAYRLAMLMDCAIDCLENNTNKHIVVMPNDITYKNVYYMPKVVYEQRPKRVRRKNDWAKVFKIR